VLPGWIALRQAARPGRSFTVARRQVLVDAGGVNAGGTEREIGVAYNALRHLDRAVTAACAHRGDAGDELDLADWAHLDRPVGAMHRAAFLEDGGDDVVAGVEVGEQFRQQIGQPPRSHR
jgi:hypothetical protein